MSSTRTPVAQFEISIDGTPRSSRDLKPLAIEAAEYLKRKHPNSGVMVKDLQSGETTPVEYKPIWGRFNTARPPGSPPCPLGDRSVSMMLPFLGTHARGGDGAKSWRRE